MRKLTGRYAKFYMVIGIIPLLIGILFSCNSFQVINDESFFLSRKIEEYQNKGFNHQKPSIVINGMLVKSTNSEYSRILNLKECEIELIHFLNDTGAKNIYGLDGINGIVLITANDCKEGRSPKISQG